MKQAITFGRGDLSMTDISTNRIMETTDWELGVILDGTMEIIKREKLLLRSSGGSRDKYTRMVELYRRLFNEFAERN